MRTLNDRYGTAQALGNLAVTHLLEDNLDRAERCLDEALCLWRTLGVGVGIADVHCNQAWVAQRRGQHEKAADLGRQGLREYADLGSRLGVAEVVERIAQIAVSAGSYRRAARLFGMAMAVRSGIGAPRPPTMERLIEAAITTAIQRLGRAEFAEAWQAANRLSFDQVIADAQEADTPPSAQATRCAEDLSPT
jgi:tetratricopeptide (TPR) repeat protein